MENFDKYEECFQEIENLEAVSENLRTNKFKIIREKGRDYYEDLQENIAKKIYNIIKDIKMFEVNLKKMLDNEKKILSNQNSIKKRKGGK